MKQFLFNSVFRTLYLTNVQGLLRNRKRNEGKITVLCLHRISDDNDYFFNPVKPGTFEKLLGYVRAHYDVIPVSAVHQKPGNRPRLLLSFDDGYYDFYTQVLPLLKQYSLPANHNIVTDIVNGKQQVIWTEDLNFLFNHLRQSKVDASLQLAGAEHSLKDYQHNLDAFYIAMLKKLFALEHNERITVLDTWLKQYNLQTIPKKMMGWNEIRECAANGVEIGSHTKRHNVLSSIKIQVELNEELVESKAEIEKKLGRQVTILAPPNGLCDEHILNQAASAGYTCVLGIGDHAEYRQIGNNAFFMSRINLIEEPHANMVMRIEELQSNIKKYVRR